MDSLAWQSEIARGGDAARNRAAPVQCRFAVAAVVHQESDRGSIPALRHRLAGTPPPREPQCRRVTRRHRIRRADDVSSVARGPIDRQLATWKRPGCEGTVARAAPASRAARDRDTEPAR